MRKGLFALLALLLVSYVANAQLLLPKVPFALSSGAPVTALYSCAGKATQLPPCTATGTVTTSGVLNSSHAITLVTKINSYNASSGGHVQVTLFGPTTGSLKIANAFIGPSQTTGSPLTCATGTGICPWNFQSTPTRLTFSGANGKTVVGTTTPILFSTDVIAFTMPSGASTPITLAFDLLVSSVTTFVAPSSTTINPNSNFSSSNYIAYYRGYTGSTAPSGCPTSANITSDVQEAGTVLKNVGYCTLASPNLRLVQSIVATP